MTCKCETSGDFTKVCSCPNTPFRVGDVCLYKGQTAKVIHITTRKVIFEIEHTGHIIYRNLDGTMPFTETITPPKRTKTVEMWLAVCKLDTSRHMSISKERMESHWSGNEASESYVWTRVMVEVPI